MRWTFLICASSVMFFVYGCADGGGDDGTGSGTGSGESGDTGESADAGDGDGSGGASGECETVDDCQLLDDCCSCEALPNTEDPGNCNADCEATACEAWGLGEITCRAGTCQLQKLDCDSGHATCNSDPPDCEPGMVPSVESNCWGPCVPTRFCGPVDDCSRCTEDQICMTLGGIESGVSCEDVPAACRDESDPNVCACQWLCPEHALQMCHPSEAGIECVKIGG